MKVEDSQALFAEFLPLIGEVNRIVEVGCHRMQDTTWMFDQFPKAKITCFEPDPRSLEYIDRKQLMRRMKKRVTLYPHAAGEVRGEADFYPSTNFSEDPDDEWTQSSSMRKPASFGTRETINGNPCTFEDKAIRVKVVPLDAYAFGPVDLLWIDAQGYEDSIIRGATKTLEKTRFLFAEHNTCGMYQNAPDLHALLKLLPDWEAVKVMPYDVILRRNS